jgi:hypothetical protein
MQFNPFRFGLLASAASLAFASAPARADLVYSVGFGPIPLAAFNGDAPVIELPQFNGPATGSGSLVGIVVTLTERASNGYLEVKNETGFGYSFTHGGVAGSLSLYSQISGSNLPTVTDAFGRGTLSGYVPAGDTLDFPGGFPHGNPNNTTFTGSYSSQSATIPSSQWSSYLGSSAVGVTFSLTDSATVGATDGGGSSYRISGSASITGTVTIDYETVPEPGTLSVLGAGLIGAGVMRRRKKT